MTDGSFPDANALFDWVNIDYIESVYVDTSESESKNHELAKICKELIQMTTKLDGFTVYSDLTEVCSYIALLRTVKVTGILPRPSHKAIDDQVPDCL